MNGWGWLSLAALLGCGYDAPLGFACPRGDPACAGASAPVTRPPTPPPPTAATNPSLDASTPAEPAADGAVPPQPEDPELDAGSRPDAGTCQTLSLGMILGCNGFGPQPGRPLLRPGQAYTVHVRSDLARPATFQGYGISTSNCGVMPLGTISVAAGPAHTRTCVTSNAEASFALEDLNGGLDLTLNRMGSVEVCEGCQP